MRSRSAAFPGPLSHAGSGLAGLLCTEQRSTISCNSQRCSSNTGPIRMLSICRACFPLLTDVVPRQLTAPPASERPSTKPFSSSTSKWHSCSLVTAYDLVAQQRSTCLPLPLFSDFSCSCACNCPLTYPQAKRSLFNAAKHNDIGSARFWLGRPARHRVNAKDA